MFVKTHGIRMEGNECKGQRYLQHVYCSVVQKLNTKLPNTITMLHVRTAHHHNIRQLHMQIEQQLRMLHLNDIRQLNFFHTKRKKYQHT